MDNKTNIPDEKYYELHQELAQTVIDFFKRNGFPEEAWKIDFSFDCLEASVKAGEWVPYSDSSLSLWDNNNECIFYEM